MSLISLIKPSDQATAMIVWIASVLACLLFSSIPSLLIAVAASTLNLLHARHVAHDAGAPFLQRVRAALVEELSDNQARLAEVERIVDDVKQAQINIAGQWRGAGQRNHP